MTRHQVIQKHIDQARIERNAYLAELVSHAIVGFWKGIENAATVALSMARARIRKHAVAVDA